MSWEKSQDIIENNHLSFYFAHFTVFDFGSCRIDSVIRLFVFYSYQTLNTEYLNILLNLQISCVQPILHFLILCYLQYSGLHKIETDFLSTAIL